MKRRKFIANCLYTEQSVMALMMLCIAGREPYSVDVILRWAKILTAATPQEPGQKQLFGSLAYDIRLYRPPPTRSQLVRVLYSCDIAGID